jgi:hypothetical protein
MSYHHTHLIRCITIKFDMPGANSRKKTTKPKLKVGSGNAIKPDFLCSGPTQLPDVLSLCRLDRTLNLLLCLPLILLTIYSRPRLPRCVSNREYRCHDQPNISLPRR